MKLPPRPRGRSRRCNVRQPRLRLRLAPPNNFDSRARRIIHNVLIGLPKLAGGPIFLSARPHLKAHRGKLVSGRHGKGFPVHAASFIRQRLIILETQLLKRQRKLKLILVHELFHFVWARLGNTKRAGYSALVAAELKAGARGELGESAEGWKAGIANGGDFKNYVCESFCDSAAWLYAGTGSSQELTLAKRWCERRRQWFKSAFADEFAC